MSWNRNAGTEYLNSARIDNIQINESSPGVFRVAVTTAVGVTRTLSPYFASLADAQLAAEQVTQGRYWT
ncbi:hypothetical protein ACFWU5_16235 [Nocardia sp. NPDC058640]|uniref:hypothetical protein n=1 Tax=Nocardia sp. NPDC058640 TaxID=3346571 RepID=UPI0036550710